MYSYHNKERVVSFPRLKIFLGHSNTSGLSVTLASKFVVYSPAERASRATNHDPNRQSPLSHSVSLVSHLCPALIVLCICLLLSV